MNPDHTERSALDPDTTEPCGIPAIRLPRDRRIAIAAERYVRAERAVLDARAEILKVRMAHAGPDDDATGRLYHARRQRNEAFHALAVAVGEP